MSQRTFTSNGLHALVGYDRPLDYFFLVIEANEHSAEGDFGYYAYSNLSDPDLERGAMSLEDIRDRLDRFKMVPPPSLFEDLKADCLEETLAGRSFIHHNYDEETNDNTDSETTERPTS